MSFWGSSGWSSSSHLGLVKDILRNMKWIVWIQIELNLNNIKWLWLRVDIRPLLLEKVWNCSFQMGHTCVRSSHFLTKDLNIRKVELSYVEVFTQMTAVSSSVEEHGGATEQLCYTNVLATQAGHKACKNEKSKSRFGIDPSLQKPVPGIDPRVKKCRCGTYP